MNKIDIDAIKKRFLSDIKEYTTETAKKSFLVWIKEKVFPAMEEIAAAYMQELSTQAEQEKGWNRYRDSIFLPFVIRFGLYLTSKQIEKMTA